MSDFFNAIIQFFVDAKNTITGKLIIATMILFLFVLADNYLGFSYYYSNSRKIEQLTSLNKLIGDIKDSALKVKLATMQNEILERKSIKDKTVGYLYNSDLSFGQVKGRSFLGNLISATLIFGVILLILAYAYLIYRNEDTLGRRLYNTIAAISSILIFAAIFHWITTKIPTLYDRPWINYTLNILLQAIYIFFVVVILDPKLLRKDEPQVTTQEV